jgi:hypothetical protein
LGVIGASLYTDLHDLSDKDYDESMTAKQLDKLFEQVEKSIYPVVTPLKGDKTKAVKGIVFDRYVLSVAHGVSGNGRRGTFLADLKNKRMIEMKDVYINEKDDVAIFEYPLSYDYEGESIPIHLQKIPCKLGNSKKLKRGDYVFSCTSFSPTSYVFKEGKVSAIDEYILHTIDCHPGDSGTPLIALYDGESHLIGINKGWREKEHKYYRDEKLEEFYHRLGMSIKIDKYAKKLRDSR